MRYCKDIMLEKAVLHVIDANADDAILAQKELTINEEVEEFVRKSVIKPLNSDDTYSAKFLSGEVPVAQLIRNVINNNDDFLRVSKHLAVQMHEVTKHTDIQPCDLLVVQYIADEQRCFAVIRLEHQLSQSHNIEFEDDKPSINLITNEGILPKAGMGYKKCAFFTRAPEDKIEMIVVNKAQKVEDGNENYFVDEFLEAVLVSDDTSKTRDFKETIEKWTQKNLADQIKEANIVRADTNDKLINEILISVDDMANELFGRNNSEMEVIKESFLEHMRDSGYRAESEFEVDKTWVANKFKVKSIKTDTGLVIKGELDAFRDCQRYIEKDNGDGTLDIIIKNVRNVKEKKGNQ